MDNHLCQWKFNTPKPEDGIIVGCANNQEWILPWWYMNYQQYNNYPITFIDFGDMSLAAKSWCHKRGQLMSLNIPTNEFVHAQSKFQPELVNLWNTTYGDDVWLARLEFFKKPFACLASPYQRTVWMDLDCQIFKSIQPLFDFCENPQGIAVAEEIPPVRLWHAQRGTIEPDEIEYNSGVIAFKHNTPIIEEWAEYCLMQGGHLHGDQEALSRMLYEKGDRLPPLDPIYNWRGPITIQNEDDCNSIVILHWLGSSKNMIQMQIDHFKERGVDLSIS